MLAGVIANTLIDPFWRLFGFQCKSLILTGAAADLTTEMRMFINHTLLAAGVTSCLFWFPWWSALTSTPGGICRANNTSSSSSSSNGANMEEDLQPNLGAGPAGSTVELLPRKPWHRGHERGVITTARAAPVNLQIIGSKRQAGNTSRIQPGTSGGRLQLVQLLMITMLTPQLMTPTTCTGL
jgi:hypothetical protein